MNDAAPPSSSLDERTKRDVLNRLKTVRGHLDGIIRLVEDDTYCIETIKQISATRASLDRVARKLLENHFRHCFVEAVAAGETDAAVAELMETLAFQKDLI